MSGSPFDAIADRHGARLLLQFGSTVSGRTHPASDVDVAVLFEGEPNYVRLGGLLADLEGAFPGRTVDLGLLNRADPLFLKKVLDNARLLAGSARELAELRLRAFRRYQDHRRFLRMEERHLDRSWPAGPSDDRPGAGHPQDGPHHRGPAPSRGALGEEPGRVPRERGAP